MCKNAFGLSRAVAGASCSVAVGLVLAGCAVEQRSLKDDLSPGIVMHGPVAPRAIKVASPGTPPRRAEPPAKATVDALPTGCTPPSACLARIKALVGDSSRKWVGMPQTPAEHADGTRQFAYRALRKKLSCSELGQAITDIVAGTKTFYLPVEGVTSGQAARVRTLNEEVEAELRAERAARCT
jgi:hypothetical protein